MVTELVEVATERRCAGETVDGEPCLAQPTASGWCWFHDPEREESRQEARRKGGRTHRYLDIPAKPDGSPGTLQDVVDGLGAEIRAVWLHDNSPARAHALGRLYAVLADVLESMGIERLELELGRDHE